MTCVFFFFHQEVIRVVRATILIFFLISSRALSKVLTHMKLLIKQWPENVNTLLYAGIYGYRPDEPP